LEERVYFEWKIVSEHRNIDLQMGTLESQCRPIVAHIVVHQPGAHTKTC
jgi:hypothetical protein